MRERTDSCLVELVWERGVYIGEGRKGFLPRSGRERGHGERQDN